MARCSSEDFQSADDTTSHVLQWHDFSSEDFSCAEIFSSQGAETFNVKLQRFVLSGQVRSCRNSRQKFVCYAESAHSFPRHEIFQAAENLSSDDVSSSCISSSRMIFQAVACQGPDLHFKQSHDLSSDDFSSDNFEEVWVDQDSSFDRFVLSLFCLVLLSGSGSPAGGDDSDANDNDERRRQQPTTTNGGSVANSKGTWRFGGPGFGDRVPS